jgi:endo-alpha-1,4-polygalactosaminidase (GH114 family)
VSETSNDPIPYQVAYSEYVRNELKNLIARAEERGLGAQVRAAAREIEQRLRVYPQFGDPLADLSLASGQIRMGTVSPLVVRYALYEEMRLVTVTIPFATLPHSGL